MTEETHPTPRKKEFPWVSIDDFHNHYSSALKAYLRDHNPPQWGDQHITDVSSSAMNFAEVWWHIFSEFYDHYQVDDE